MKKIFYGLAILLCILAATAVANAVLIATITIRDASNNVLDNTTINPGTMAYFHGTYSGQGPATGRFTIYLNGNLIDTIQVPGSISSGQTIIQPYTFNQIGTYEIRWTCRLITGEDCGETAQVRTRVTLVIPEPSTIFAAAAAFGAFGLVLVKQRRLKH
jgi:hypothetical protein